MSENDMKLPKGKTTDTCEHFHRCNKIFGCPTGGDKCDFAPSRYVERGA